jgi:hypothetical protein
MTTRPPGSPPQGSVWIVCALRLAAEPEVRSFERRVLAGGSLNWDRFWTTPPLRPCEAVFEMNETTYSTEHDRIHAWVGQQPELGELRVVRPHGA